MSPAKSSLAHLIALSTRCMKNNCVGLFLAEYFSACASDSWAVIAAQRDALKFRTHGKRPEAQESWPATVFNLSMFTIPFAR